MIKILDNIIPKKEQNLIKNTLLDNAEFPWTFVNDVSIKNNKHQTRPGFKHIFRNYKLIESILVNTRKKLKVDYDYFNEILEVRSFLQLPLEEKFRGKGVDTPHLDRYDPHLVILYYVNDSDGQTVIYNYKSKDKDDIPYFEDVNELKRITPKQGRIVVFDGRYWHTAEQPTKNIRCIININIDKSDEVWYIND